MSVSAQRKEVTVDPTQEYLSGGVLSEFFGFPIVGVEGSSTLFPTNDQILLRHGLSTYEQMMLDPKVSKCVNVLKTGVCGDQVELMPSVGESNQDYSEALEVANFCISAINNLQKPLRETLEEMLDALIYGYKIAEVTYEIKEVEGFSGQKMVPNRIKVKPFTVAKFVVDRNYNVIAIAGVVSYSSLKPDSDEVGFVPIQSNSLRPEVEGLYLDTESEQMKIMNREKFMVLTLRPRNEDPRGTSFLKPAFGPYYLKQQIYPEYLRYLLICAIPLLVGFTPENETIASDILKDADGNPVLDSSGKMVRFNAVAALRGALLEARNATALALKGGSSIKEVGNQGNNGIAFSSAIEIFNEEIEAAILLQTLATSESKYQTRAASQVHMGTLDQLIWSIKNSLIGMIQNDLLKVLIKYNFGESYLKYMPKIGLGDTERRNFAVDSSAVSNLFRVGYFTEDQLTYLDNLLGLPIRDTGAPRVEPAARAGNPRSDVGSQDNPLPGAVYA